MSSSPGAPPEKSSEGFLVRCFNCVKETFCLAQLAQHKVTFIKANAGEGFLVPRFTHVKETF